MRVAKAPAMIRRTVESIDRVYLWHLAVLGVQAGYLFSQRAAGYRLSLTGFAAHIALLCLVVAVQAALFAGLPAGRRMRIAQALLAACVQLALLTLYIGNHASLLFAEIPLTTSVVTVYRQNAGALLASGGISAGSAALAYGLLAALVFAINAAIFARARKASAPPKPAAALVLCAALIGSYALARPVLQGREFLHALEGRLPGSFGPPAMFLAAGKSRALPRYPAPPAAPDPRPLVLIVVDSLRADSLDPAAPASAHAPFLRSRIGRPGWTAYPEAHSICTFSYCGIMGILAARQWREMTGPPDTIYDTLARYGYRNYLFASGHHRGFFDLARQYGPGVTLLRDGLDAPGQINEDTNLLRWFDEIPESSDPRQMFHFHLMSVHRAAPRSGEVVRPIWARRGGGGGEREANLARARYNQGVEKADRIIEEIFARLERRGLLEDALVAITADHGELLGEGGEIGHGQPPIRPLSHVPLWIYDGRRAAWPTRALASTTDIAPTFLAAIGSPVPLDWSGVPLQTATMRCAVESAMDRHRVIIGTANGRRYRYWQVRRDGGARLDGFLEPEDAVKAPANRVDTQHERAVVAALEACLAAR